MENKQSDATADAAPASPRPSKQPGQLTRIIVMGIAAVVLVGIGIFAGMQIQKGKGSTTVSNTNRQMGPDGSGGFGGRGMGRNGSFGTVSAVSATSITVNDEREGASKTYGISSSTTITNSDGTAATYSDIKAGDRVIVTTGSSTSTDATRIRINPVMGGGPGGQSGNQDSGSSQGSI